MWSVVEVVGVFFVFSFEIRPLHQHKFEYLFLGDQLRHVVVPTG